MTAVICWGTGKNALLQLFFLPLSHPRWHQLQLEQPTGKTWHQKAMQPFISGHNFLKTFRLSLACGRTIFTPSHPTPGVSGVYPPSPGKYGAAHCLSLRRKVLAMQLHGGHLQLLFTAFRHSKKPPAVRICTIVSSTGEARHQHREPFFYYGRWGEF